MRASRFVRTTAFVLTLGLAAKANDTLVTLGAGGLVPTKSSEIVMESEDLEISVHQISVRYVFRNNSDHDVDATVAFPLPALEGSVVYNEPIELPSKSSINFVDFKVEADGKPITVKGEVRAFANGKDVTAQIRQLGLPISVIDNSFDTTVKKLPANDRQQLLRKALIAPDESYDARGNVAKTTYWPNWEMRVQYYWTQHFPARSAVNLVHRYQPVVGGSYLPTGYDGSSAVQPYCGGQEALTQIKSVQQKQAATPGVEISLWEKRISYILTTGNNWSEPIRQFRLSVLVGSPDDIVLTCMPGLKRVAPTRYELARTDFHPDQELELLILQATK
jgi:hypothetical protein